MLIITIVNIFRTRDLKFPVLLWLPWSLYIVTYILFDFSFLGLQLTLQYLLPLFIGIVTSGFTYSEEELEWILKRFIGLCVAVFVMSVFGIVLTGYGPAISSTPMLFSVSVSLLVALWFLSKNHKYLLLIGLFFLVPVMQTTRMGIAALTAIVILHFANRSIKGKLTFGGLGLVGFILVFNSSSFQNKTFYSGKGTVSDVTFNYYENSSIKSNGRNSWKKALEPGLRKAPIWGNGPRSDNNALAKITKRQGGEAHNDYLSVRFNYGYVGLALLLFGFASTFLLLYRISNSYLLYDNIWLLSTSALTLFISFLMFMYTDNILKYTIYFPNYFFAMIGIVYGLKRDEDISGYTSLQ